MSIFKRTALTVALLAVAPVAFGATAGDDMIVSITIENSCTIAAEDLSFGTVNSLASGATGDADVTVTCTNQGPISVAFSAGSSTDQLARTMAGPGTATIDYQLYDDASLTTPLGDGTGGTATFADSSSDGGAQIFTVYGEVPAQGAKPVGAYSDTITATITY